MSAVGFCFSLLLFPSQADKAAHDAALPKFPFLATPPAPPPEALADPADEVFDASKGHSGYGTTAYELSRAHTDYMRTGKRTVKEAEFAMTGRRPKGKPAVVPPTDHEATCANPNPS